MLKEFEEQITIDNFHQLSKSVKNIIFKERIDIIERIVSSLITKKRFEHSLSVARVSKDLALANHYDPQKAYLAGILHDITKSLSKEEHLDYLRYYDQDKMECPEPILHSYSAKYFIKEELNYYDDEVLEAIYHHTDGLSNGKLSKILYIADKREPLRGLDPHILNLAYTDLNKAFIELKEDVKEYLANRNE